MQEHTRFLSENCQDVSSNEEERVTEAMFEEMREHANDAIQRYGMGELDVPSDVSMSRFTMDFFDLEKKYISLAGLRCMIDNASRRNIEGAGGVAEQLGVSKNAVYLRLKTLHVSATDLRDSSQSVEDLWYRIPKVPKLYARTRERLRVLGYSL